MASINVKTCAFLKTFQKALNIYTAILSVCPCAHPSVMFLHMYIVLKRLNMSSYFLQRLDVAQSFIFFQY